MKRCHDYAELDLFSECGENAVTEKVLWDEFLCNDVLTNDLSELNFTIRAAADRCLIDLNRAQLYVRGKIVKKDGSETERSKVAPVNNFLHSMFEDCTVFLNDIEVSHANKLYPYSSYFLDLFETTNEAKESYMTAQLWHKNGAFNSTDIGMNPGFAWRAGWFGNREHGMIGKLHSDLFQQDRYLLNGVEVKVKLSLGKPGFFLMSNERKKVPKKKTETNDTTTTDDETNDTTTTDDKTENNDETTNDDEEEDGPLVDNDFYKFKITDAKMYVPYVHVSDKAMDDIEKQLEKKPAVYPIQRLVTKAIPINARTQEHLLENISKGQLPNKMIVGLVSTKAKQQDLSQSPFFFGSYNVKKIEVNVDGMPYSKRALTPDTSKGAYTKTYMNMFESLNYIQEGANTPVISSENFRYGYALYPFNLNPGPATDPGIFKKTGNVNIYLEFEESVRCEDLQLVVMCVYDKTIKIDNERNFTKDW